MIPKSIDRAHFLQEAQDGAFNGVVAVYRTFSSVEITGRFDEDLIKDMPESLKFVCHNGELCFTPIRAIVNIIVGNVRDPGSVSIALTSGLSVS